MRGQRDPRARCGMIEQLGLALPRPPAARIEHALGWHYEDLSDFEFRLVLDFPPVTIERRGKRTGETFTVCPVFSWKRAHEVSIVRGHASLSLTPQAKAWAKRSA